jgi:hypothetical protein
MSHYGVNAGVPKTLMQYLVRWCVKSNQFDAETDRILEAILQTKISPELVPADEAGMQSTEDKIGPYELHDFFLFHTLRSGQPPSKVAFLAWSAWHNRNLALWPFDYPEALKREYDLATIEKVAARIPAPLLRRAAIQALDASQFTQGVDGRIAEPARRLAGTIGRRGRTVAGRAGARAFDLAGAGLRTCDHFGRLSICARAASHRARS